MHVIRGWERVRAGVALAAVVASAMLVLGPGFAGAQSPSGSDPASGDPKASTQSTIEAPKSQPKTAGEVGDRLHDSAKGFGEALLDSIKYAGNKVVNFFSDDKSKK